MAKLLKHILGKHTSTKKTNDLGGYKPKAGDEEKFAKKHNIDVHDNTVATEDQFKGGTKEASFPKQSEGVYEAKKAEDTQCNRTPKGTACPVHGMSECMSVKTIKETENLGARAPKVGTKHGDHTVVQFKDKVVSHQDKSGKVHNTKLSDWYGDKYPGLKKKTNEEVEQIDELSSGTYKRAMKKAAYKAMWDPEGETGKTYKKYSTMAKKFRSKGMEQERKEKGIKEESIEELSKNTLGNYAKAATNDIANRQYRLGKGDLSDTRRLLNRRKGVDKAINKIVKEEEIEEGANVDRMVAHIKSSEKKAGKSDKKAEQIAWATANKRGMLDNKNKKMEEDIAYPMIETDDAAEMAKAELKALANKALHLVMQMPESMHVEPWCQAKIAQAKSMITDVHDYMIYGNHKEEDEQTDTPMDITTASNPPNSYPNFAADVNTGRNV